MQKTTRLAIAVAGACALGLASASAQDGGGAATTPTTRDGAATTCTPPCPGMMGRQGMRRPGLRGGAPWLGGHGAMAPMMMRVMFIAIDTDGSGTLSLDEVQAFHKRMFDAADEDGDGELTPAELRAFMIGGGEN